MNGTTNTHGYTYDQGPLTPQETIPVKLGESYKTRFGNEHIQQRNLDLPSTPASGRPTDDIEAPVGGEAPIAGIMEVVDLAIYWENPVLSTVLCILGVLVAIAGEYLLKGRHGVPLLSVVAYALLLDLGVNFFRSVFQLKWHESAVWLNSHLLKTAQQTGERLTLQAAWLHDRYLCSTDPVVTLKVAAFLWILTYLGYALSIWRLVTLAYFSAFAFGAVRTFFYATLKEFTHKLTSTVKARWESLGVSRRYQGVALALTLLLLAYYSSWSTRVLTVFVGLVVVRANLKTSEVESIAVRTNKTCAPYINSAKKQGRRLSMVASDFVRRSSFGASKIHHK